MPLTPPFPFTGRTRLLVNVLLATVVLRLLNLAEHSFWLDEGVTWWNATRSSWRETIYAEVNHPPGWWIVTRAWITAFPGGETALRMPAALLGVLSVPLMWLLARRLSDPAHVPSRGGFTGSDPAVALWVTGLAAANPFWIQYAQEARMYAALLAASLGLSVLYLRWLDLGGRRTLVFYGVLAAAALYTHYFAAWPLAAHAAHALWLWRRTRGTPRPFDARPLWIAQAAAWVLFLPWFVHLLQSSPGVAPLAHDPFVRLGHGLWRMGVGPALLVLDAARSAADPMEVVRDEWLLIALTALAWFVPMGFGVRSLWRDVGGRAFVLLSLLVPVGLVLLAAVRWNLVEDRYLIFLAPFLLYLAVLGARTAPRPLRPVLLGGLLLLHAAGLFAYHLGDTPLGARLTAGHPYGKEQWREAHALVASGAKPGDVVLLHARFTRAVWAFYAKGDAVPATPVPPAGVPLDAALTAEEMLERVPALATAGQVFLVLSHESTADPSHYRDAVAEALLKAWNGLKVEGPETFPRQWGIRVFRFARP
jgi:mannosyltransferase